MTLLLLEQISKTNKTKQKLQAKSCRVEGVGNREFEEGKIADSFGCQPGHWIRFIINCFGRFFLSRLQKLKWLSSPETEKWKEVNTERPSPRFRSVQFFICDKFGETIYPNVWYRFVRRHVGHDWQTLHQHGDGKPKDRNRQRNFEKNLLQTSFNRKREFVSQGTHKH